MRISSETRTLRPDFRRAAVLVICASVLLLCAIFVWRTPLPKPSDAPVFDLGKGAGTSEASAEEAISADTTRFLLNRLKHDPEDFLAQNMLASSMLQKVRETGNADYLERALKAARASLASVPEIRNPGGLGALARAEMAEHNFVSARQHALRLTQIDPVTVNSWGVLTDALLELGEYAEADAAIQRMRQLGSDTAETEIRLGRLLFLESDTAGAEKHFFRALAFTNNVPTPPRETVAWCRWQLGEMKFSAGDYPAAERYYNEALSSYPGYVQALASLGRVRAAEDDLPGAIRNYENAVQRFPDPTFIAALGDLYRLAGREKDAQTQFELVNQIQRLSVLNGVRYNRQIALIYADHDTNQKEAYRDAAQEYRDRKDIYGADTLAWTALKAGNLVQARKMADTALRLWTRDSKLFYHAGMIAQASGDRKAAHQLLQRALDLSPRFDPLQATLAQKALLNN